MAKKQKISKGVQEFGRAIEAGFLYNQLVHMTVSIYKSKIKAIKGGKLKPPGHPKVLVRQSFETAKNRLLWENKFLTDDLLPTHKGIEASMKMMDKELERSPLLKKSFMAPFLYGVAIGTYLDPAFNTAQSYWGPYNGRRKGKFYGKAVSQQKGSANKTPHTCPETKKSLEPKVKKLRKAMKQEFSCDTAYGTCNKNSMASGHCMLSALIVQDLFGGKIMGGVVDGIPHYWNRICHYDVDLTGDQFNLPEIQIKRGILYPDGYEFNRDPFESMNQDFNKEVWGKHCKFRKGVRTRLNKIDSELAEQLKKASAKLSK